MSEHALFLPSTPALPAAFSERHGHDDFPVASPVHVRREDTICTLVVTRDVEQTRARLGPVRDPIDADAGIVEDRTFADHDRVFPFGHPLVRDKPELST